MLILSPFFLKKPMVPEITEFQKSYNIITEKYFIDASMSNFKI